MLFFSLTTGLSKTKRIEHTSHETYVYGTLLQIAQGPNNICWDWHNRPLGGHQNGECELALWLHSLPSSSLSFPFHSLRLCPLGIKWKERKMRHQPERLEGAPREYLYSNQLCKDIFEAFFYFTTTTSSFNIRLNILFNFLWKLFWINKCRQMHTWL